MKKGEKGPTLFLDDLCWKQVMKQVDDHCYPWNLKRNMESCKNADA